MAVAGVTAPNVGAGGADGGSFASEMAGITADLKATALTTAKESAEGKKIGMEKGVIGSFPQS